MGNGNSLEKNEGGKNVSYRRSSLTGETSAMGSIKNSIYGMRLKVILMELPWHFKWNFKFLSFMKNVGKKYSGY